MSNKIEFPYPKLIEKNESIQIFGYEVKVKDKINLECINGNYLDENVKKMMRLIIINEDGKQVVENKLNNLNVFIKEISNLEYLIKFTTDIKDFNNYNVLYVTCAFVFINNKLSEIVEVQGIHRSKIRLTPLPTKDEINDYYLKFLNQL